MANFQKNYSCKLLISWYYINIESKNELIFVYRYLNYTQHFYNIKISYKLHIMVSNLIFEIGLFKWRLFELVKHALNIEAQ